MHTKPDIKHTVIAVPNNLRITGHWLFNDPEGRWRPYEIWTHPTTGQRLLAIFNTFESDPEMVVDIPTKDSVFVLQDKDQYAIYSYQYKPLMNLQEEK